MKLDRLMGILTLLLQSEKATAPELARRLEVSRRTIQRDIEALSRGQPFGENQADQAGNRSASHNSLRLLMRITSRNAGDTASHEETSLREAILSRPRRQLLPREGAWGIKSNDISFHKLVIAYPAYEKGEMPREIEQSGSACAGGYARGICGAGQKNIWTL